MIDLGHATYSAGQGGTGLDGSLDTSALSPGDVGRLELTFPFPINFIPGEAIAAVLGPIFGSFGQTLNGVDFNGDSTIVLTWTVG